MNHMERLKGYFILILSLFVFAMWGINLISLAQIETEVPGTPASERVETRSAEVRPRPFPYFFIKEAGFEISLESDIPADTKRPFLIVDPPVKLESSFNQALLRWVRSGGKLVFLFSTPQAFATSIGAKADSTEDSIRPAATALYPAMRDVETLSLSKGFLSAADSAPFHRFFKRDDGASTVLATWRGTGDIVLVSGPDFSKPDGLSAADNVMMLTRILESVAPDRRFVMLDPGVVVSLVSRVKIGVAATPPKKVANTYLSLWSLVSANPISWVLVQLVIALLAYFYALGRRFSRPVPLPDDAPTHDSFITGMGRLLHRRHSSAFAAQRLQKAFLSTIKPRLGLPAEADHATVIGRFGTVYPGQVAQLKTALQGLMELSAVKGDDETALLTHVRGLETIRKELKIND
ncbi:MAG: hypothetical protein WA705_11465 [Candidatus Ozemobacteraceae bacterium]